MKGSHRPHHVSWVFPSLRGWKADWLPHDLIAGLLLTGIAVPEQLATARLAGLPPETGLIAFVAGSLAFAIFGVNRFLSVGADSTIAPIFAGGLAALATSGGSSEYAHLAALLALMVGAILIVATLLRAGWIADLLSIPVTTGFLAGVAVHIMVSQVPAMLGVAGASGPLFAQLDAVLTEASSLNPYALVIGLVAMGGTQLTERLAPHVPGALIALLATAAAVPALHLRGVAMLTALSPAMPLPSLAAITGTQDIVRLAPLAAIVALVCIMQTATVVRTFPGEGRALGPVSPNFAGIGVGSLLAALFGAFPVNASPPRTAAVVEAGGRSQLASLIAVGCVVMLVLHGGTLLRCVPQAALAGVLIAIAVRIFRVREMARILRHGGSEILLVVASAALVIALPIETGMLCSIALSLLQSFYAVARPLCIELVRAPGTTVWWPPTHGEPGEHERGVLVFAPAAPLNFTNAVYVCRRLESAVASAPDPVHLIVIEASGIVSVDYTGSRTLQDTIMAFRAQRIDVALARLSAERAQMQAEQTGLLASLGGDRVFRSVEDAITVTRSGRIVPASGMGQ